MDYKSWSNYEAVPLSNGIVTRRTGFQYLKSPEEISSYYKEKFGDYWFNELPKTDNTYSATSKYHGCTLAPGIPLIPNLCRRPLRSPQDGGYDYTFTSAHAFLTQTHTQSQSQEEVFHNHVNSWRDQVNIDSNYKNGKSQNGKSLTRLRRRGRIDFQDSGLESDSELEDSYFEEHRVSQNTVTWLSWIITTVTTVITTITTTITETIYRTHSHDTVDNHIYTRVPLQENAGVAWYQYPVLWMYKLAMYVHQLDVWVLSKANSVLKVDSWGTPQQRRKWALILLLIFPLLWAGYKLLEWLMEEDSENLALLTSPFISAWDACCGWLTDAWGWLTDVAGWFDGSWLWAPWIFLSDWFQQIQTQTEAPQVDDSSEPASEVDFAPVIAFISWPFVSLWTLLVSLGEVVSGATYSLGEVVSGAGSTLGEVLYGAASSVGDGSVTLYVSVTSFLVSVFTWILGCLASIPVLLSSGAATVVAPFQSMTWESGPASTPVYSAPAPPPPPAATPAAAGSVTLDQVLRDKHLLAILVSNVLASDEFQRAMNHQQTSTKEQVDSAVNDAFTKALSKIDFEFTKVKGELNSRTIADDSSTGYEVESLKQQLEQLRLALNNYKSLVSEQAALASRLEARLASAEQAKAQDELDMANLKSEVEKVREDISVQLLSIQNHQNVVINSGTHSSIENTSEIEALVNSTVNRLLAIYDADKIAKVDYALASSGGFVLNVRCTETYSKKNAQYYWWGLHVWNRASNDPKIALEPAVNPGECWAFAGSRGYLVIELSENITVTGFTMEHLPRSLNPTGTIDTAPKNFKVFGLDGVEDDSPLLLGEFRYEDNDVSLQQFQALEKDRGFKVVELIIESNHGNLEYTCLYRFRVHGRPVRLQ